ncbi:hypothetical protein J2W89_004015 [Pseudarthrobacter oxydans]|nr:hypothetical protein [Pseudarthrobacter oxydans]
MDAASELIATSESATYLAQQNTLVAIAGTQATLALAYEQRTANLLATFGFLMDGDVDTFLGQRIDGYELAKDIQKRLAL